MFAVVGRWKLDPSQMQVQREVLTQRIVPGVRHADGFVAGYWSKPTEHGYAHSFIIFDERSAAEAIAESVRRNRHNRESHGIEGATSSQLSS